MKAISAVPASVKEIFQKIILSQISNALIHGERMSAKNFGMTFQIFTRIGNLNLKNTFLEILLYIRPPILTFKR